jgi:hypothetical protein
MVDSIIHDAIRDLVDRRPCKQTYGTQLVQWHSTRYGHSFRELMPLLIIRQIYHPVRTQLWEEYYENKKEKS